MTLDDIGYIDETPRDYAQALTACHDITSLRKSVERFACIADDARIIVWSMTADDWPIFKAGFDLERRGMFAGERWASLYAAVMMPEIMVQVTLIAHHFRVPWGTAFVRCMQTGMIVSNDGVAKWKGAKRGTNHQDAIA